MAIVVTPVSTGTPILSPLALSTATGEDAGSAFDALLSALMEVEPSLAAVSAPEVEPQDSTKDQTALSAATALPQPFEPPDQPIVARTSAPAGASQPVLVAPMPAPDLPAGPHPPRAGGQAPPQVLDPDRTAVSPPIAAPVRSDDVQTPLAGAAVPPQFDGTRLEPQSPIQTPPLTTNAPTAAPILTPRHQASRPPSKPQTSVPDTDRATQTQTAAADVMAFLQANGFQPQQQQQQPIQTPSTLSDAQAAVLPNVMVFSQASGSEAELQRPIANSALPEEREKSAPVPATPAATPIVQPQTARLATEVSEAAPQPDAKAAAQSSMMPAAPQMVAPPVDQAVTEPPPNGGASLLQTPSSAGHTSSSSVEPLPWSAAKVGPQPAASPSQAVAGKIASQPASSGETPTTPATPTAAEAIPVSNAADKEITSTPERLAAAAPMPAPPQAPLPREAAAVSASTAPTTNPRIAQASVQVVAGKSAAAPIADRHAALRVRAATAYAEASALKDTLDPEVRTEVRAPQPESAARTFEPPPPAMLSVLQTAEPDAKAADRSSEPPPPTATAETDPVAVAPSATSAASLAAPATASPAQGAQTTPPEDGQPEAAPEFIATGDAAKPISVREAPNPVQDQRKNPTGDDNGPAVADPAPQGLSAPPSEPQGTALPAPVAAVMDDSSQTTQLPPAAAAIIVASTAPAILSVSSTDRGSTKRATADTGRDPAPSFDAADATFAVANSANPEPAATAPPAAKRKPDKETATAPANSTDAQVTETAPPKNDPSPVKLQDLPAPPPHATNEENLARNTAAATPIILTSHAIPRAPIDAFATQPLQPSGAPPNAMDSPVPVELRFVAGAEDAGSGMAALALRIAAKSVDGDSEFHVRLDPPELGGIEVTLRVNGQGQAEASLSADKPQTLDLLQRDSNVLERTLKDAGLDLASGGLSFSLKSDSGTRDGRSTPEPNRGRPMQIAAIDNMNAAGNIAAFTGGWADQTRLDIRI